MEPSRIDGKKRICVVTTNRADYGRMKPVMRAIQKDPRLELQIVVGSHLFFDYFFWYLRHGEPLSLWKSLPWYLRARRTALLGSDEDLWQLDNFTRLLRGDGFPIHARIPMFLEGGNPRVMTKVAGLCLLGITDVFQRLKPDLVLVNGDRFELLPVAFAAVASNIRLAHIEGGDVSGTLDESTRHAITKLAHIHFPATEMSAGRIRQMGEDPRFVFPVGSPVIDTLMELELSLDDAVFDRNGPGGGERIDVKKPFLLILQHPVTTRYEENQRDMEEIIAAVESLPFQKLFLTPNIDAGSDGVSAALRSYRERRPPRTAFFKNFLPHDYYRLFTHASVAIGNSSSFIREGAFLGVPAVVVGDRQHERERGENVMEVPPNRQEIARAIETQRAHGRYSRNTLFGDGTASQKIAEILATVTPPLQKQFIEKK